MISPARAMLWQLCWPHRYGLLAGGAYLVLAAVFVQLLPAILRGTPLSEENIPDVAQHLAIPSQFIFLHLMAIFVLASATLKESGYPARMFVLPMRAWELAAWPMLWGCAALTLVWFFVAGLILRPAGVAAALLWPAAALSVCLALLQALSWTPFARNWMRIAVTGLICVTLALATFLVTKFDLLWRVLFELGDAVVAVSLVSLLPLLYAAAVFGVACGRRGDALDWPAWHRIVAWFQSFRRPLGRPFASRAAAQFWFECRGHLGMLPTFVGLVLLCISPFVLFAHRDAAAFTWRMFAIVLVAPLCMAGMMGGSLGKQDVWSDYAMKPFLGCRPISTAAFVRSKLLMAAVSAAAAWAMILCFLPLFLLRPGFFAAALELVQAAGALKSLAIAATTLAALMVGTWLMLVINLWIGLTGRAWFVTAVPAALGTLIGCGILIGFWIYLHPQWYAAVRSLTPWALWSLVALKPIVAAGVLIALARSRLVSSSATSLMAGAWIVIVAGLWLIGCWLVPSQHASATTLLGGVVLFVPFSRLAAAPLALAWNRHR